MVVITQKVEGTAFGTKGASVPSAPKNYFFRCDARPKAMIGALETM